MFVLDLKCLDTPIFVSLSGGLEARPRAGMPGGWTAARDGGLPLFMLRNSIPNTHVQPNENQLPDELLTKSHHCIKRNVEKFEQVSRNPKPPPLILTLTSTMCPVFISTRWPVIISLNLLADRSCTGNLSERENDELQNCISSPASSKLRGQNPQSTK